MRRRLQMLMILKSRQTLRQKTARAIITGGICAAIIGGIISFIFYFSQSPESRASGNQITFRSWHGMNFLKSVRTMDGCIVVSDGSNFVKFDSSGNIIWSKGISQSNSLVITGICEASSGDIVAACQSTDTTGGTAQISLTRINADGSLKWSKLLHKQGSDFVYGITADVNDGVILCGGGCSTNQLYMKINSDGDIVWMKDYSLNGAMGSANKIIENADGSMYVCGRLYLSGGNFISVLKADENGTIIWAKKFLDQQQPVIKTFRETADNSLLIGGTYIGGSQGSNNPFLLKTDLNGNLLWFKRYGTSSSESINDLAVTADGGAVVIGNVFINQNENVNALLFRIDANGAVLWQKSTGNSEFNGAGYDDAYSICHLTEHNYAVVGMAYWAYVCNIDENGNGFCHESPVAMSVTNVTTQSMNASYSAQGSNNFTVTDAIASVTNIFIGSSHTCESLNPTSVNEPNVEEGNGSIELFPNPNDGNFNLNYALPNDASGYLEIYDLNGEHVSSVELPAYNKSVSLHLQEMPSGVYLYQIMSGGNILKREKFVISK